MIPFIDLSAQNHALRPEFEAALGRVLERGVFILGPEVAAFERDFAAFCSTPFAVAVNSGTAALQLALQALGIGPGDEVIVPPFTFIATASAVLAVGAQPVFADIEAQSFGLDPKAVEAALSPRTRAIVPVHLFGQMADMDALGALAESKGVALVEDAAQAHGAEHRKRRAGALGALGAFSFYPTKNLGALGEGGLVTTCDAKLAEKLRLLRDWGQPRKYIHEWPATNARMDAFQGALLGVKLRYLPRWTELRRAHAERYRALLPEIGLEPVFEARERRHVYHVYNLRVPERDSVHEALKKAEVGTGIVYPLPLHLQPALASLGHGKGDFPQAERAAGELLALPMYPELEARSIERVVEALGRVLRAGG